MNDAYSLLTGVVARIAGPLALLLSSCSGGAAADKQAPGQTVFPTGDPSLAVHIEAVPAGPVFYFQYCSGHAPGYVRHYILVDEVLSDERWEPICAVRSVGFRCRGSVWRYGETPKEWQNARTCEPLRSGKTYRISPDGNGSQEFKVEDDGSIRLLDGLCPFEPPGGPASDAERRRYGWACRGSAP